MTSTYREANQAISFGKLVIVPPHCCSLSLLATTGLALPVHTFGVSALGETSVRPKILRMYYCFLFLLIMLLLIALQEHE